MNRTETLTAAAKLTKPQKAALRQCIAWHKNPNTSPTRLPVDAINTHTRRALIRRGFLVVTGECMQTVGHGWTGRRYKRTSRVLLPTYGLGFEYAR